MIPAARFRIQASGRQALQRVLIKSIAVPELPRAGHHRRQSKVGTMRRTIRPWRWLRRRSPRPHASDSCLSSNRIPASAALIRRGRRVADYLRADCLAVYVSKTAGMTHLDNDERDRLQRHFNFAQGLQIDTRVVEGEDLAKTLVDFARPPGDTQVFIAGQKERTLRSWFSEGLVQHIVKPVAASLTR